MKNYIKFTPFLLFMSAPCFAANIISNDNYQFDIFGNIESVYANRYALEQYGEHHNSIYTQANLGLAMRTLLNNYIDGIGLVSYDFDNTNDYGGEIEYLFVGIDAHNYGQLTLGRGDSAYYTIIGNSDIFEFIKSQNQNYYNAQGEQRDSQFMYSLSALNSDLRLSYQMSTDNSDDNLLSVKKSFSAAIFNEITDQISLSYGLEYYEYNYDNLAMARTNYAFFAPILTYDYGNKNAFKIGDSLTYGINLNYGHYGDGLYLTFIYSSTKYEYLRHHLNSIDAIGAYSFANGITLTAGYQTQRYDEKNLITDLVFGVKYQINPNFLIYMESLIDLGSHNEIFYGSNEQYGESQYVAGAKFMF